MRRISPFEPVISFFYQFALFAIDESVQVECSALCVSRELGVFLSWIEHGIVYVVSFGFFIDGDIIIPFPGSVGVVDMQCAVFSDSELKK